MIIEFNEKYKTLYLQVYEGIKKKIIEGSLEKNYKLPSIRRMAQEYKISKNTVIEAYYQLELEGYIRSVEKKGFFVNEIENLLISKVEDPIYKKKKSKQYRYDFSMDGIDPSGFPFSIWKNIYSEIINKDNRELLVSGPAKGDMNLRYQIAKYLNNSRGLNLSASDLVISSGTENLFNIITKLFDQNTIYGFENPGYPWGSNFFFKNVKNAVPINMDSEGIRIVELKKHHVDIGFVTPAHQFPTGIIMSINRRIQLLNRFISKNHYIIEDDYDSEFKYKGKPIPPLKSMDVNDRVIYIGNFSKSLSPALRISYMALPKTLMKRYDSIFEDYTCSCSTFVQKALAEFMYRGDFEKHINRMRTIYAKKYDLCERLLSSIDEIHLDTPQSGNSFLIKIKNIQSIEEVNEFLLKCEKNGIKLCSVNKYRHHEKHSNDFIFGFAKIPMEDIEPGIRKLKELIE